MKPLASEQNMSQLDFSVVVLGLKLHDRFEEEFRVVEYTCSSSDLSHQTHAFNMCFVLLHEVAAKTLRIAESISCKIANYGPQFTGEGGKKFDLFTCPFSSRIARSSVVGSDELPAINQRSITIHSLLERRYCFLFLL